MSYLKKYILIMLFMTAIPHILYESIKYYNVSERDSFLNWFMINVEYEWDVLKYDINN